MVVEFDTTMSEQDFRSLVYYTSLGKHTWVPGMLILGMGIALMVVVTSLLNVWSPALLLELSSAAYVVLVLLLLFFTDRSVTKSIAQKKVPVGVRYHIRADLTAMTCSLPETGKQRKYPWKDMAQMYETPEYFIFYIQGRNAFIFNKQSMGSQSAERLHTLMKKLNTIKYNDRTKKKSLIPGIKLF